MKSKIIAVLSVTVVTAATLISTSASGDSLDRGTIEKKLRSDFSADQIHVVAMKENYWGLYKNYQVTFNAKFADGTYDVSCKVIDRDAKNLKLGECSATDRHGAQVDIAKYYAPGADSRVPASSK